jgi:hypothetical protein
MSNLDIFGLTDWSKYPTLWPLVRKIKIAKILKMIENEKK